MVACSNLPSKQQEPSGEKDALVTGLVAIEGEKRKGCLKGTAANNTRVKICKY